MQWGWILESVDFLIKFLASLHLYIMLIHKPKGRANVMPRATVNTQETQRFDLKTLPAQDGEEAGFVELRRMSYGEFLARRDMVSKMSFQGQGKDTKAFMEMAQETVTRYEFTTCIVDHNLEDEGGQPIDFRVKRAFTILDPTVGEEIAELIDQYNGFNKEDEEELGN